MTAYVFTPNEYIGAGGRTRTLNKGTAGRRSGVADVEGIDVAVLLADVAVIVPGGVVVVSAHHALIVQAVPIGLKTADHLECLGGAVGKTDVTLSGVAVGIFERRAGNGPVRIDAVNKRLVPAGYVERRERSLQVAHESMRGPARVDISAGGADNGESGKP